jgi:hypothetical protein
MAEVLGSTNPKTLRALNAFAVMPTDQGWYIEAENVNRQVLRGGGGTLKPDDEDTLLSINNLAKALDGQDRWDEAKELYQRAIDGRIRALGPTHIFTLQSMNSLARMLEKKRRKLIQSRSLSVLSIQLSLPLILGPSFGER